MRPLFALLAFALICACSQNHPLAQPEAPPPLQQKLCEASAAPLHFAVPMQGGQRRSVHDVDFHRGEGGQGRIEIDLSDADGGMDIKQQGGKLIVDFMNTALPERFRTRWDAAVFETPVDSVAAFVQGDDARFVVEARGNWEPLAYQKGRRLVLEIMPKDAPSYYAGEKLTCDFQDVNVSDALNAIADVAHLNIVVGDGVSGRLALRLQNVPWYRALEVLVANTELGIVRNGSVILVAPSAELDAWDGPRSSGRDAPPGLRTEGFNLRYRKGEELAALLLNKGNRILSRLGSAEVDKHTNTLFVQDTPSRMEDVRSLIKKVDVPARPALPTLSIAEVLAIAGAALQGESYEMAHYSATHPTYDYESGQWRVFFMQSSPPYEIDGNVLVHVNDKTRNGCVQYHPCAFGGMR